MRRQDRLCWAGQGIDQPWLIPLSLYFPTLVPRPVTSIPRSPTFGSSLLLGSASCHGASRFPVCMEIALRWADGSGGQLGRSGAGDDSPEVTSNYWALARSVCPGAMTQDVNFLSNVRSSG